MSEARGWRVALAGASGAVGREIASVLVERRLPVLEVRAFATERSAGDSVDWGEDELLVEETAPPLRGLDLLIVATPPAAALELVRDALRAEVPVIDCSGALAGSAEVPLVHVDLPRPPGLESAPVLAQPTGPALAWAAPLAAVHAAAGLRGLHATWLRSASGAGHAGPPRLSDETVSLLSHRESEEGGLFAGPVAFDCVPLVGDSAARSAHALRDLARLLDAPLHGAVQAVQVPTFVADGGVLWLETEKALDPSALASALGSVDGVELREDDTWGPSTRDAAGGDEVLVGALQSGAAPADGAPWSGAGLWIAADAVRLAARNAVSLAEARLGGA